MTASYLVWPDLATFCRLGKSLQVFGKFLMVYLWFGKMLSLLWQISDIIGLIFFVVNGQVLKNNVTIWSHCKKPSLSRNESKTSFNQLSTSHHYTRHTAAAEISRYLKAIEISRYLKAIEISGWILATLCDHNLRFGRSNWGNF